MTYWSCAYDAAPHACIGVISGALLQLRADFDLSCRQSEIVVSALLAGAMLASFCGGKYYDAIKTCNLVLGKSRYFRTKSFARAYFLMFLFSKNFPTVYFLKFCLTWRTSVESTLCSWAWTSRKCSGLLLAYGALLYIYIYDGWVHVCVLWARHVIGRKRRGFTVGRTAFVLGSFETSIFLVWFGIWRFGIWYMGLNKLVKVTWHRDTCIPNQTKERNNNRVFSYVLSIYEKTVRDIEITSMYSYLESGSWLFGDTRMSAIPSPHLFSWGRKYEKLAKNPIFHKW